MRIVNQFRVSSWLSILLVVVVVAGGYWWKASMERLHSQQILTDVASKLNYRLEVLGLEYLRQGGERQQQQWQMTQDQLRDALESLASFNEEAAKIIIRAKNDLDRMHDLFSELVEVENTSVSPNLATNTHFYIKRLKGQLTTSTASLDEGMDALNYLQIRHYNFFVRISGIGGLVILVLFCAVIFFVQGITAQRITRKIIKLDKWVRNFPHNNGEFHLSGTSMDELDDLAENFQTMSESVIKTQKLLNHEIDKEKEAEKKLSLVIECANLGYWDWQIETDSLSVNDRWLEILGVEREKSDGKYADWAERLHPGDRLRVEPIIKEHIDTHRRYVVDFRMRHHAGHWVWIQGSGAGVEYDPVTDKPIRACGTHQDITEQKRLEEDLLQAHKMEAMGTLAGGIAHDFNNILSAVIGFSELAKDDVPADSNAAKDIDQVLKASGRAADLVKQILAFSRKSDHSLESINPHVVIKEALKMLRSSLPTTINIEGDIDHNCGKIMADPTNIHQIVVNLCTNAVHAMDNEKGILTVSLQRKEVSAEDIAGEPGVSPGPFVVLEVRDTGMGMDQATLERIFEPYFTTKEVGKGTGLGLAVIHGIIQDYHGFIHVRSEPEKGTIIAVNIPVWQQEGSKTKETKPTVSYPTGTERILVVDDESMIVNMSKTVLERLGYKVTATTQSLEALEQILLDPDQFDLVITDQTMPYLTGAEMAKKILEIKPSMPIILCTGYSSILSKEDALAVGIKKYATKPVPIATLSKIVRQVLDEK